MFRRTLCLAALALLTVGCWPDASTTGPDPVPTAACPTADLGDGGAHTLTGCVVHGTLHVTNGTTLSIDDVVFDGTAPGPLWYALYADFDAGLVVVDGCEIFGDYRTAAVFAAAESTTISGCEIHGLHQGADGVKAFTGTTLVDSYVHDLEAICCDSDPHADGVQIQAPVGDVLIRHNTIEGGNNAAIQLSPERAEDGPGPVVIDDNVLGCDPQCGYTLRVYADSGHEIAGVEATNNLATAGTYGWLTTNYTSWTNTGNRVCHQAGQSIVCDPV